MSNEKPVIFDSLCAVGDWLYCFSYGACFKLHLPNLVPAPVSSASGASAARKGFVPKRVGTANAVRRNAASSKLTPASQAGKSSKRGPADRSGLKTAGKAYTEPDKSALKQASWQPFVLPTKFNSSLLNKSRFYHPISTSEDKMLVLGADTKPRTGSRTMFVASFNPERMQLKEYKQAC